MTLARDREPIQYFEKSAVSGIIPNTQDIKAYTPRAVEVNVISKKLHQLENQKTKDDLEYRKTIPPSKRRQLFEAERHREKMYTKLKNQKLQEIKKQRIINNAYRSGALGINLFENDNKFSSWKRKSQDLDQQLNETKKAARTQNIMMHTAPSPNIQFFNTKHTEAEQAKPRGLKKVDEIPEHYHDTHNALFVPKPKVDNYERTQRLKELWRGNRDFDIISGSYFKI